MIMTRGDPKREAIKRKIAHENLLKKRSRTTSIKEGLYSTVNGTILTRFISPFAIALNASNAAIAMLSSIPGLLGPLTQVFSSRLIEKESRKSIVLRAVLYELLIWIPIIAIAYLFYKNLATQFLPILLIIFVSIRTIFGNMASPAWFSWMGDITDEDYRGRYFSKRDRLFSIVTIIVALLGAVFLDYFRGSSIVMLGFGIFFFIAMVSRSVSRYYLSKQYEPKMKVKKDYYFTFWDFIAKMKGNNFGRYTLFNGFLHFAVAIASPFFAVYMLRNLGFSYLTFILVALAPIFFHIPTVHVWGKITDKFGGYFVLKIAAILVSIMPILWLFSGNVLYLIFVPQLVAGLGWSGYHIASSSFIYSSISPQKRAVAISYYNFIMGIGIFLGAALGAVLVKYLSWITFIEVILLIFLISGIARGIVSLTMLKKFKEVRKVQKATSEKVIEDVLFHKIAQHNGHNTHSLNNHH